MKVEQLYSLKDAAELLGVSEALLRKWRLTRKLKVVKVGGCVRVTESELRSHIEADLKHQRMDSGGEQ
ncbi:helix-turn-helix domain-containing protein [Acidobacteria bacterium AH-259-G07]|nr:helix-turn-helix domain-containing protein [Acidobacteria bacterium AH-259-G07]